MMSFDLFRKIVDDLKAFETRLKLVSLYKDGEPLLHKQFPEMAAYVKASGVADRVWTKTNGAFLNPELNRRLVERAIPPLRYYNPALHRASFALPNDVHALLTA